MTQDRQFVFIIGAARSGTTWLQAMLEAHPSVCSTTDELKLFDFFTAPWAASWEKLIQMQKTTGSGPYGLAAVWTEDEFYQFLNEFVERVYTSVLAKRPDAMILLDKAPGYSNHVEHISRLVPRGKFIHIIRDGRDVAASLLAASQEWGKMWAPKKVASAASLWKSSLLNARKTQQYEDRYLEVYYEQLLTNGVPLLQKIFEFIGAPLPEDTTAAIYAEHGFEKMKQRGKGAGDFVLPRNFFRKGRAGDWRNTLNPTNRYIFHETAGDLLCALGYATESWWAEYAYQRITLPAWVTVSSRQRIKTKTRDTLKRVLGPKWTERARNARTLFKHRELAD